MFYQSSSALLLSEACLQAFYASLNAPVVHLDGLAAAPARAAIVVYAEEYGGLALGVGLRSVEQTESVVYRYRDPIAGPADVRGALEAAFDFAEGLGFLFDDDMLVPDCAAARQRALQHWSQLMSGRDGSERAAASGSASADVLAPELGDDELLLDDLADLVEESGSDSVDANPPAAAALASSVEAKEGGVSGEKPADAPLVRLTKFRRDVEREVSADTADPSSRQAESAAPAAEGAPLAGGGSALGRVPIVRMRRRSDSVRSDLLARLLSSF